MDETTARTLLAGQLTDAQPPTSVDVDRIVEIAHRRQRTRTRWVAAAAAGLVLLVTATVALVAGGLGFDRPGPTASAPATLTPAVPLETVAPTKFDPLETRLVAGWLPADIKHRSSDVNAHDETLWAGRKSGSAEVMIAVEARGRTPVTPFETPAAAEVTAGPRINGVPSRWHSDLPLDKSPRAGQLQWEWAPGAIAVVRVNDYANPEQVAVRIATALRVSVGSPVRLPFTVQEPPGSPVASTGVGPEGLSVVFGRDADINVTWTGPAIQLSMETNTLKGIGFKQNTVLNGRPAQIVHDGNAERVRVMYPHVFVEVGGVNNPKIGVTNAEVLDLSLRVARSLRLVGDFGDRSTWTDTPLR
jgi:hypothetical protein